MGVTFKDISPVAINLPTRPLIHKEGEVCARIVLGTAGPHIEISGTTGTRLYAVINLTDDDIRAITEGCDHFRSNCIVEGLEAAQPKESE